MFETVKATYGDVGDVIKRYWNTYGALKALVSSPYLHASCLIALMLFPLWTNQSWWDLPLSILPNILGFTLAGFTIWLGFGNDSFRALISKSKPNGASPYMGVSAGFAHFVIVQLLALLAALFAKASHSVAFPIDADDAYLNVAIASGDFLGFLLFIYALLSALAATLGVFRAASWADRHNSSK